MPFSIIVECCYAECHCAECLLLAVYAECHGNLFRVKIEGNINGVMLKVEGFVKIARIGTVTIPDRQKTVRTVS